MVVVVVVRIVLVVVAVLVQVLHFLFSFFLPKVPRAKLIADFGEKCGETLARNVADFRPSISRKSGRKRFHEKSSTTFTSHETLSL